MKKRVQFVKEDVQLLKDISLFADARKVKLYLVGGVLRDLLLGRKKKNPDYDFCLKKCAINFGAALARKIKAGFVVLDSGHGACRLVKTVKDKTYTLDFSDFRGKTIEEDLSHRDFTINAIALDFKSALTGENLRDLFIDPCFGCLDMKNRLIRITGKTAFSEDPLRIMRAFSFAAMLDFDIDRDTLRLLKSEKNKLASVSLERVRDELFRILESGLAFKYLLAMDDLKVLKIVFPEIEKTRGIGQGPYHHLDVWQHTLETVKQFEILVEGLKKNWQIQAYLDEIISPQRTRENLLKLGAFLHDIGKPAALRYEDGKTKFHGHEIMGLKIIENICRRLKLSNNEAASLKIIVLAHLRPGYLADMEELSAKAKFRYFRDTAKEAVSVLLLSIADQRATKGPFTTMVGRKHHEKVIFGLIEEYFRKQKEKTPPRLINGHELMRKFKLKPSPLIGRILSEIEELRAIGKIKTKEEAFMAAEKLI